MGDTKIRQRDAQRTRHNILQAAQTVFSTRPYSEASLKDICRIAGVNVALVNRYFGSKELLFEMALSAALDVSIFVSVPRQDFGRAVAKVFTQNEPEGINPLPMLVYASAQSSTRDMAVNLVNERILAPFASWVGGKRGQVIAAQIMAIATGYFTYRLILPLEPFESKQRKAMETWLTESLQVLIDNA